MNLLHFAIAFAISTLTLASSCERGHEQCRAAVSRKSYCRRESKTCHGAPEVACACSGASTGPKLRSTAPARKRMRAVATLPSGSRAVDSTDGMFLWLEWPAMRSREWSRFYDRVLSFMQSNCGSFKVSRVIARVLDPNFQANRGNLWQVSTESVFYRSFLSQVPSGTEIFVYPYLLESSPSKWLSAMGTSTALEAVYKYVSEWNQLLASVRPDITIGGIVVDFEEHKGFESHLPRISDYRIRYSSEGQPRLRFGAAMGYDVPRRAASISANIDDVYLEMYDFYVKDSAPAKLVQQGAGRLTNSVSETLAVLDRDVWGPFMKSYGLPNMHFMWSLQARSSKDCLYPPGGVHCGTKDDLGGWEAEKVAEFINTVKARYPAMANKPHGFFEFSYMPTSWMKC